MNQGTFKMPSKEILQKRLDEIGMPEQMFKMQTIQINMHKPLILEALLKDNQAALEELKNLGLYKPINNKF